MVKSIVSHYKMSNMLPYVFSGVVTNVDYLDRETLDSYSLRIKATDQDTSRVSIYISSCNTGYFNSMGSNYFSKPKNIHCIKKHLTELLLS